MSVSLNPTQQNMSYNMSRGARASSFFRVAVPQAANYAARGIETAQASSFTNSSRAVGATAAGSGSMLVGASSWISGAFNVIGGVQGAWDLASNWGKSTPAQGAMSGAAVGAAVGSFIVPGVGTAIGAAIGTIAGGLMGMIHTGKHKDQIARDQVRAMLTEQGFLGEDHSLKLADGSLFDIGKDGGAKTPWGTRMYDIDFKQPFAGYAVSWMNPLADLICGGNEKLKTDFCGYFANAVMSNAHSLNDVAKNVAAVLAQFGLNAERLAQTITQGVQQGRFPQDLGAVYMNGVSEWMSLLEPVAQAHSQASEIQ